MATPTKNKLKCGAFSVLRLYALFVPASTLDYQHTFYSTILPCHTILNLRDRGVPVIHRPVCTAMLAPPSLALFISYLLTGSLKQLSLALPQPALYGTLVRPPPTPALTDFP